MAQKRKRSKKWICWVVILVLLVAAGVVVYLVWDNYFRDKSEETDAPKTSEVVERTEEKKETKKDGKETENNDEEEDDKKVKQYDGEDPNKAESLSGVVTYAGVFDGNFMVRVNIDQYLSEGSCGLELIKDGAVAYSGTAAVAPMVSTATCDGFNIPVGELAEGVYEVAVKVEAGGKTGVIRGEGNV